MVGILVYKLPHTWFPSPSSRFSTWYPSSLLFTLAFPSLPLIFFPFQFSSSLFPSFPFDSSPTACFFPRGEGGGRQLYTPCIFSLILALFLYYYYVFFFRWWWWVCSGQTGPMNGVLGSASSGPRVQSSEITGQMLAS